MTEVEAKDALEALIAANEAAFVPKTTEPRTSDDGFDFEFEDEDDISSPPSGITFGMIRRAREALAHIMVEPEFEPGDCASEPENFE